MPVQTVTLPDGSSGFQWGTHGAKYKTRKDAERQGAAAYAHGYAGDGPIKAAGIAFVTPDGQALFLRRSDHGDHAGEWCLPAGTTAMGETPEATARRESFEEIGPIPEGVLEQVDHQVSEDDGVEFTTFRQDVDAPFDPTLNAEHTAFQWAPLSKPPAPLHPGVEGSLQKIAAVPKAAADEKLALDRATVRRFDEDGRLHVEMTNISKSNVCPYRGSEIPDAEALGLDPTKVYMLLRDPAELEKAAVTFNNIPLLSEHVPVSADDPQKDLIVGSTGTDAVFVPPYLKNSLVVWDATAIEGIENDEQRELSCAYRYQAIMEPGEYEGVRYDGRMVSIVGNHVAIVSEGRAGSDVIVGDSKLQTESDEMNKRTLAVKAMMAKGAVLAHLHAHMAADAKLDLNPILAGVRAKDWKSLKAGIVDALTAAVKSKKLVLAADADIADVCELLDKLDGEGLVDGEMLAPDATKSDPMAAEDPAKPKPAVDPGAQSDDPVEKILSLIRGKVDDEALAAIEAALRAAIPGDTAADALETDEEKKARMEKEAKAKAAKPAGVPKAAMDEAIRVATKQAEESTIKRMRAIAEAEKVVKPYVGELAFAQDSADGVYKLTLETMGVDIEGVHPSAYRAILEAQPKPGAEQQRPRVAMDAAQAKSFSERYPHSKAVRNLG